MLDGLKEMISQLPVRAQIALAAHCARLVQLMLDNWEGAADEQRSTVARLIRDAESFANRADVSQTTVSFNQVGVTTQESADYAVRAAVYAAAARNAAQSLEVKPDHDALTNAAYSLYYATQAADMSVG